MYLFLLLMNIFAGGKSIVLTTVNMQVGHLNMFWCFILHGQKYCNGYNIVISLTNESKLPNGMKFCLFFVRFHSVGFFTFQ